MDTIEPPFYPTQSRPNWIFLGRYRNHFNDIYAWDIYVTKDHQTLITVYGAEHHHYSSYPVSVCKEMVEKGTFLGITIKGKGLNNPRIEAYKRLQKLEENLAQQSNIP